MELDYYQSLTLHRSCSVCTMIGLRWLGAGQQITHQICLKLRHRIFLAINYS